MTFVAAVLTGGASRRMGRDKATIPIDGVAMAARVAAALRLAGAGAVVVVGRPVPGEDGLPDRYPGDGPLGGVLTALEWSAAEQLVVAPCDLVAPTPEPFAALVAALEAAGSSLVAVAGAGDPLPLALRPAAEGPLQVAWQEGERSLQRALARLDPLVVDLPVSALVDADVEGDLPPGAG